MGQTPSDRLDTVAAVAAAIEAAGNEITDLRAAVDNDTGRGTVHVSLPMATMDAEPSYQIDLVTATLADGTLQLELDIITDPSETTTNETASPADSTLHSTDENSATQTIAADQPPIAEHTLAEDDSTSPSEATAESTRDAATADSDESVDDDHPPYRDPDRLAAVYDPDATFAEMTDALGVDVTPQTVRRYMIEHDIHDPTSRASDTLAATDGDDLEVTNTETDDDRSVETTAHEDTASGTTSIASPEAASPQKSPVDNETDNDGEPTATTATETDTPDQPTIADDTAQSAPSDSTASIRTEDETDNVVTEPPDGSADNNSAPTSTATDGGTQPTLSAVESIELPDEVSASELVEVLTDSRTVYEVRRGLGVTDTQARTLLRQHDLIDLVTGRIRQGADPPERQEVLSRLIEGSDQAA